MTTSRLITSAAGERLGGSEGIGGGERLGSRSAAGSPERTQNYIAVGDDAQHVALPVADGQDTHVLAAHEKNKLFQLILGKNIVDGR